MDRDTPGLSLAQGREMTFLNQWREMIVEQVRYRDLLYQITLRDLLLRYKQNVMGLGWAVFTPLINTVVFSVVFMKVARIDTPVAYPLFAYCGLLTWNFFAASLRISVPSLTSNGNLVTKIYFPREVFPFSAVIVSLVDFGVASLILLGMMAYYHVTPTATVLFLPVVLVVNIAFAAGVALFLSMSNLFYRDVKYLMDVLITVWMFVTPVLYPTQDVDGVLGVLLKLNPMMHITEAYRQVLLYGQLPNPLTFVPTALFGVLVLGAGWYVFHRTEFKFAENI